MSVESGKRMAENYEITQSMKVGDREVVFGIDEKNTMPYFCAFYERNDIMGAYSECMVGDDYLEITELFSDRIKEQCVKTRMEQTKVTVPREIITKNMCFPMKDEDLVGKIMAVRAEILRPEYRTADNQLILITGGHGAKENSRGSACFYKNIYSGESGRWERYDLQGEVKPECLPQWAKEKLSKIEGEKQMSGDEVSRNRKNKSEKGEPDGR